MPIAISSSYTFTDLSVTFPWPEVLAPMEWYWYWFTPKKSSNWLLNGNDDDDGGVGYSLGTYNSIKCICIRFECGAAGTDFGANILMSLQRTELWKWSLHDTRIYELNHRCCEKKEHLSNMEYEKNFALSAADCSTWSRCVDRVHVVLGYLFEFIYLFVPGTSMGIFIWLCGRVWLRRLCCSQSYDLRSYERRFDYEFISFAWALLLFFSASFSFL